MNFTLSTLLVIFFLIPGFIFRRAYYSSPFARKYSKFSLLGEISWIIIPSFIFQILGIYLIYWAWYVNFLQLQKFYDFIIECYKSEPKFKNELNFHVLIIYTAVLWVFAAIIGYLVNLVIRRTHLDKRVKIFSFDNEWYYYLSGEILDFPNIEGTSKDVGLTFVDVLTKTGEETVLYSGICQKFDLKEDGGLASICLTNAQRKGFANKSSQEAQNTEAFEYKDIPSTFLVIPFDHILNLNVRFFKVKIVPIAPQTILEKNESQMDSTNEKKHEINLSTAELVLLTVTFFAILVAIISIFSKPEKPKEELEEDQLSSYLSLFIVGAILLCHFAFRFGWLASILFSFAGALIFLFIIKIINSKKRE